MKEYQNPVLRITLFDDVIITSAVNPVGPPSTDGEEGEGGFSGA